MNTLETRIISDETYASFGSTQYIFQSGDTLALDLTKMSEGARAVALAVIANGGSRNCGQTNIKAQYAMSESERLEMGACQNFAGQHSTFDLKPLPLPNQFKCRQSARGDWVVYRESQPHTVLARFDEQAQADAGVATRMASYPEKLAQREIYEAARLPRAENLRAELDKYVARVHVVFGSEGDETRHSYGFYLIPVKRGVRLSRSMGAVNLDEMSGEEFFEWVAAEMSLMGLNASTTEAA